MKRVWKGFFPCIMIGLLLSCLPTPLSWAGPKEMKSAVQAPPYTQWQLPGVKIQGDLRKGEFQFHWPANLNLPVTILGIGPLGEKVLRTIHSPKKLSQLIFRPQVILDKDPDPEYLKHFPQLCPRLRIAERPEPGQMGTPMASLYQPLRGTQDPVLEFVYDTATDGLNHIPHFQLSDPDAKEGKQEATLFQIDGRNVLMVRRVKVLHDYEDAQIVDLKIVDPDTGAEKSLVEGRGGFYANFHYAVFPYHPALKNLDSQTLLHLAQGSLKKINRMELRPELRTHSFLPGPFFSQRKLFYDLCEWGDTAHQAPVQELNYESFAIWDWDYSLENPTDRLMMVIWEGDEEDSYHARAELTPNYLVDDLVAVFTFRRQATEQPLTLINSRGDFEITLQTGNMKIRKKFPF